MRAAAKSTAVDADRLNRLGIECGWWPRGLRHTGTRAALMEAGIACADQFPGQPGRGKTSVTIRCPDYVSVRVWSAKLDMFTVCKKLPDDELRERDERETQAERLRNKQEEAENFVASWPNSADAYRARIMAAIYELETMMIAGAGYNFDDDEVAETVRKAINDIRSAITGASVRFDESWRTLALQMLRSEVAVEDAQFQTFVATVTASAT